MGMAIEMLPCSFCGSPAEDLQWPEGGSMNRFGCSNHAGDCVLCGIEATLEQWNARVALVADRQDPVAWGLFGCEVGFEKADFVTLLSPKQQKESISKRLDNGIFLAATEPLYRKTPETFYLPSPEYLFSAISEALGQAMDCDRKWSEFGVWKMREEDFSLVADDQERLEEIAISVLDKIKEFSK